MTIQVSPSSIANSDTVSLTSTLVDGDTYLVELLNQVSATKSSLGWLQELRQQAANWVRHSTIPTTRDEEWRFTDLSALRKVQFDHVETRLASLPTDADLPSGVRVGKLTELSVGEQERVRQYLAQAEGAQEVFTALNTAGLTDAAVVLVGKNVVVEEPIHLVFLAGETATISQPRCLVVAESGSQVTLVEEYGATPQEEGGVYLTNAVTEIWVGENAQVSHTRVMREGVEAFHIGKTAVTQARDSRYTCNALAFGGKLSRHNLEILQTGEQTATHLNGLTMIWDRQLADTHSAIALNYPYGVSRQLHKCIVGDRAHAVFNGKVFVPKAAQQTDAGQLNRNLLLSSKARVDTKPQLEITADNVKCAHGATVSQLEDDEIFYLQSRGIGENDARKLLVNAFAAEIINQIPVTSLKETLLDAVNDFKSLTNS